MKWIILPILIGLNTQVKDDNKYYKYTLHKDVITIKPSHVIEIGKVKEIDAEDVYGGFSEDFQYDIATGTDENHPKWTSWLEYCPFIVDSNFAKSKQYYFVGTCEELIKNLNGASSCSN